MSKTFKVGDYNLSREVLGEGASGKIIKAHYLPHNSILAVKMVLLSEADKKLSFDNEARIAHVCALNPHGIPVNKIFTHDSHGFISMQLFDATLSRLIAQKKRLSPRRSVLYFKQICKGVSFMHERNIGHLNLSPQNILLCTKDSLAFVSDFANSFFLETEQKISEGLFQLGTRGHEGFQAPEILVPGAFYSPIQADIWSLGVILLFMISGYFFDNEEVIQEFSTVEGIPPECMDLLSKIIVADPKRRISITNILQHPFITQYDDDTRTNRSPIRRFRRMINPRQR